MKSLVVVSVLLFSISCIHAQDVITKMADGTCACIQKNEVDKKPKDNLEIELGLCMVEQVGLYRKELAKAGFNTDALDFYEKLGEQLGVKLVVMCPYFVNIVSGMMADENSDLRERVVERMDEKKSSELKAQSVMSMNGKVQAVEYGDFVKFAVTDASNRRREFYWISAFDGDDNIMLLASPDGLIGKNVNIQYVEEEVYFHKLKSYLGIKKITALSID